MWHVCTIVCLVYDMPVNVEDPLSERWPCVTRPGNAVDLLKSMTMPAITQARASIDYDWTKGGTNNQVNNWAAPDRCVSVSVELIVFSGVVLCQEK